MGVVICPGMHELEATHSFLANLGERSQDLLVFPAERYPAYSTPHIVNFLHRQLSNPLSPHTWRDAVTTPLVFIAFSAGVVGAIGAANLWQWMGGKVKAFIAIDGWGVPLLGNFPIHRLSHDSFTHWSSIVLGSGSDSFYADPPVAHLDLWRSPQTVGGWWSPPSSQRFLNSSEPAPAPVAVTADQFLRMLLLRYGEPAGLHAVFYSE